MSNNIGSAISSSFAFVSKVGDECEALANLIKQEISELFRQSPLNGLYKPGEWSSSYSIDGNGWIFNAAAWSLPLTPKGKRKATAHLAFQMNFLSDDPEGGGSPEPLLHINFWETQTDLKKGEYMGFPMHDISSQTVARLHEGTACLFRWGADNGAADWWTFSLRLAQVNGLEAVRSLITRPVEQLLVDCDLGETAVDQIAQVVRYSAVEGMPDYYRVVR